MAAGMCVGPDPMSGALCLSPYACQWKYRSCAAGSPVAFDPMVVPAIKSNIFQSGAEFLGHKHS